MKSEHSRRSSALTFARDKGFEREAVIDERALFVDAMRRGMGEMTYPEVRANFEARVASGEFRDVAWEQASTGRHFTTAETIQAEKEIIRSVQEGQGRAPQIMSIQDAIPLTEARPATQSRRSAKRSNRSHVPRSNPGIAGQRGLGQDQYPGRLSVRARNRTATVVEGFAPTSRAAHAAPRRRHHRRHLARLPRPQPATRPMPSAKASLYGR